MIDTREQRPLQFPSSVPVVTRCLPAGDYSIAGHELRIAIERKSKSDAYGTIGQGRERFLREIERLASYDYAAIVIESSMRDFLQAPHYSGLHPHSAVNSLLAWSVRYGVPVIWTDTDRRIAAATVLRLLEKWYKYNAHAGQERNES